MRFWPEFWHEFASSNPRALQRQTYRGVRRSIHGSDEIADVTGAGDTVIATFTLALAAGAGYYDAARLANYAGGIVVMKYGTRPVMREELSKVIGEGPK